MKQPGRIARFLPIGASVCSFILLLAVAFASLRSAQSAGNENGAKLAKQALERSAVMCYASEGYYPPSLSYITENYGVQVDENEYLVKYEVFAANQFPEIAVVVKK